MTGIIYFTVIICANLIGAVSGMGGGVIIKPVFDFIGQHSVGAISFYSSVAVFTMAVVSTFRQLKNGLTIKLSLTVWVSSGAIIGGIIGNEVLDRLLQAADHEESVQLIQIGITISTLVFAFLSSRYQWKSLQLTHLSWYLFCGFLLGFLASMLGIGGGPINVALLMLLFGIPIKAATVYSICTILFSQLSKLLAIFVSSSFLSYDCSILAFVIPAAILGGFFGATVSKLLTPAKVTLVFQLVILVVLFINFYNGWIIIKKML